MNKNKNNREAQWINIINREVKKTDEHKSIQGWKLPL